MTASRNFTIRALFACACTAATLCLPAGAVAETSKTIKCWKNTQGVRECGNIVPPEYTQKGYDILNEQGMVIQHVKPPKSKEQLAEEARQAEIREEEQRQAAIQANYDRALLSTYTSADDMVMARDGKLRAVDTTIKLIQSKIDTLKESLQELRNRAAAMERAGNPVSDQLHNEITDTQRQIDENRALIEERHHEQEAIRRQFEANIERFRQLRGDMIPARE